MKRPFAQGAPGQSGDTAQALRKAEGSGRHGKQQAKLAAPSVGPLMLPLDRIDEDPLQPRSADNPGFSKKSMTELAASIRLRGVKTPISVRERSDQPGRYLVNHGARRLRGARLADLQRIPAFIDNDYNEADQVVENLHRNELTAREIADFIGRELAKGRRKGEIATMLSKSPAYVSQHAALLDLPEPLARAFGAGRVRDVTLVNELLAAHRQRPDLVGQWLNDEQQEVTRGTVRMLRAFLTESNALAGVPGMAPPGPGEPQANAGLAPVVAAFHGTVLVTHHGREAYLQLRRRPSHATLAWVRYVADGTVTEVPLAELVLLALLDGAHRTGTPG